MDTLLFVTENSGHRFEIVEGRGEGVYVLRYADLKGPTTTHDYLQDTVPLAMECAHERFGIAQSTWRKARIAEQPAFRTARQTP